MFHFLKTIVIAYTFLASKTESAKILCIYPMSIKSHHMVYQTLTQELARRGHELTVFTSHPAFQNSQASEKITEIYINGTEFQAHIQSEIASLTRENLFDDKLSLISGIEEMIQKQLLNLKDSLKSYSEDHFDLIFLESGIKNIFIFSHIFNAPTIKISPIGPQYSDYSEIGAPTHPILYPSMNQQKIYNLTIWEKIQCLLKYYDSELIINPQIEQIETQIAKNVFGKDIPSIRELIENVDMLFLQTHPIWEGNIPVPPNVVYVWGLHHKPGNPLPTDVQNLLDSSTNGVIYVSFGSMMKSSRLPNKTIQAIVKALSRVPYDICLKWEEDILPGQPKNVHIRKWWPQADILRHSKVKLFVGHGGLMSVFETIVRGVPVVNIPLFGDHFSNAEKCVHHKIGVKLELGSLTEDQLFKAINTVIEDESYRRNIIKLGSLMMDQPQTGLERAVWWTEYVLRNSGAKHLRTPAAHMSWSQYYEIELAVTIICIIISTFALVSLVIFFCYKYVLKFWRENKNSKSKYKLKDN